MLGSSLYVTFKKKYLENTQKAMQNQNSESTFGKKNKKFNYLSNKKSWILI